MYIKRLVVKNIKGFEHADLDFCEDGENYAGWCVITGDNGSGKTALLKSIALSLLGPSDARALIPDLRGWATEGFDSGTISLEIKPNHEYDKSSRGGFPIQSTFWAEVEFERENNAWTMSPADVFRNKKKGAVNGPWAPGTAGWFTLGYGPFRRLYGSSPEAQRLMVIPGRIPRFATLFKEDATLSECEQWVKQLNYKKLESKLTESIESVTLDNLLKILGDNFLREGVQIDEVNSDGIWLTDSANRRMPLSDMSEGYRSALAMLIDIFRHMVEVYGPSDIVKMNEDGIHYVNRPGVVVIDEVDSHLHPAWQREIGFWLKQHFPLVQFIVTTHSPLVCQAADNGRIYHIPQPGQGEPFMLTEEDYARVIAGKPDEILLTPAFGLRNTRSPRAVTARTRRARLKAKEMAGANLAPEEQRELEQLQLFV
ncbi:AAA family ATPase [Kitasatospora sp. NPDC058048]|uniref:AAA family ATPase n=1 Tax=Kitasatospora sp. NPDC058048 TaxID=3346313 RepID=UPI0036DD7529